MPRVFQRPSFFLITAFLPSVLLSLESPLPSEVTIITRDEFHAGPYLSAADLLEGRAGLDLERSGVRGTRTLAKFRGREAGQTTVLIDGMPVNHEFDGAVDLSLIPVDTVERIEITRGGASLRYGAEASGGVINVVTARPENKGLESHIETGVGRDGAKHHHGRFHLRHYVGDITYIGQSEATNGFQTNEDIDGESHFGSWSRSFAEARGYYGVDYAYRESDRGLPEGTPVALENWNGHEEQVSADPFKQQDEIWQRVRGTIQMDRIFGGRIALETAAGERNSEVRSSREGPLLRDQENRSLTSRLVWISSAVEVGVDRRDFRRELDGAPVVKDHQSGAFAIGTLQRGTWLMRGGLRFDSMAGGEDVLSPRVTAVWSPTASLQLSASSQRSFRAPSFDERFLSSATLSNLNLKPEKLWSHNAGIAFGQKEFALVRVTGFLTKGKDTIVADASTNQWQNTGESKTSGVENELSLKWGNGRPWRSGRFIGTWTIQKSRIDENNNSGFVEAAMAPSRLASIQLETALPRKLRLINEWRYQSEQFELPNRLGLRVPGHGVWNVRFLAIILKAEAYLAAENISRERYAETIAGTATPVLAPQPDVTFWTGLRIRFDN